MPMKKQLLVAARLRVIKSKMRDTHVHIYIYIIYINNYFARINLNVKIK